MTRPVRNRYRPIVAPLRSLVQIRNNGHSATVYLTGYYHHRRRIGEAVGHYLASCLLPAQASCEKRSERALRSFDGKSDRVGAQRRAESGLEAGIDTFVSGIISSLSHVEAEDLLTSAISVSQVRAHHRVP